jgi:DNA-binding IclR family transcriptional regulator
LAEHTYEELKHMTVNDLRDLAAEIEHEAVQGYTQLKKEQLIPALCTALGIETHEHHEVVGINKGKIKAEIRRIKQERDEALAAGNKVAYKAALRQIHRRKHELRKATV